MAEVELTRTRDDRRRFSLEGVGDLRLNGWPSRRATAEAGGVSWELRRRGVLKQTVEATDAAGTVVGSFKPTGLRRGGPVRCGEAELSLRPASRWRECYALADGDRELAVLDGKGWGSRPVTVTVEGPAVEPGLLLFTAFIVRGLAEDAGAGAAANA